MSTRKILLVGELNSPHFQKWIEALHEIELFKEIFVLDVSRNPLFPRAINFINHQKQNIKFLILPNFSKFIGKYVYLILNFKSKFAALNNSFLDVIHIFNIQDKGYKFLQGKVLNQFLKSSKINGSKIFLSSYGSDLTFFSTNPAHRTKILALLEFVDLVVIEGLREIEILKDNLNYAKPIFSVNTNSVGIRNILTPNEFSVNSRNLILIKGNFGFVGRPFSAIDLVIKTLTQVKSKKFKVILFSVPREILDSINVIFSNYEIDYEIFSPFSLTNKEMLTLYKNARLYVGCSLTEGLSTSAIEAASQGAVFFQTDSSSIVEHLDRGLKGFLVDLYNLNASMEYLQKVIDDDNFYESIAKSNLEYVIENFSFDRNKLELKKLYNFFD